MNIRTAFALLLPLLSATLLIGCKSPSAQEHFDSPDKAVETLVSALRTNNTDSLNKILGKDATDVLSSGDPVADSLGRESFLADYDAKHALVAEPSGAMTLSVGPKDWPLPIPLVRAADKGGWYFDTRQGMEEIVNRRVGRNELRTIQTCLAYVDAQREYALADPDGDGYQDYAQRLWSDEGQKNGLYWPTGPGEPPSPLGELVSEAAAEGYATGRPAHGERRPYHGYYYKMLLAQGPDAAGGAFPYVINGKMLAGFGLVAWPAEYGNSGVMTFIVNQDGVVYERDLGATDEAKSMVLFNPGAGWKKSDTTLPPE